MYKAHSKDINRNKSFHPLTFNNLQRVEKLKQKASAKEQADKERTYELSRDQQKRRYDELALSSSFFQGVIPPNQVQDIRATHSLEIQKIFAAEYQHENQALKNVDEQNLASRQCFGAVYDSENLNDTIQNSLLGKFKQEVVCERMPLPGTSSIKAESDDVDVKDMPHRKHHRSEKNYPQSNVLFETGSLTSSDLTRIKKERDLIQKQRMDPQLRVSAHENTMLVKAAHLKDLKKQIPEKKESFRNFESNVLRNTEAREKDAIEKRIRAILNMCKEK